MSPGLQKPTSGLWIFALKNLANDRSKGWAELGKTIDIGGIPPPPHLLKGLLGAGFAKSVCKILMANGLEVKILTTNGLGPLWPDLPGLPSPRP